MEFILSAVWSIPELLAADLFWDAFLPRQRSRKGYLVCMAVWWAVSLLYLALGVPNPYRMLLSLATFVGACCINYRGSWVRKLLFAVLAYLFGGCVDTIVMYGFCLAMGTSLQALAYQKVAYIAIATLDKIVLLLIAWLTNRFRSARDTEPIQKKWLLQAALFPAVSLAMLAFLYRQCQDRVNLPILLFTFFLVAANAAILRLLHVMEKSTRDSRNLALIRQQVALQTDSILTLERNYRTQRQYVHEHLHQLQTISDLLASGENAEAERYIRELMGNTSTRIFAISSNHPIIDAVLNQKYQAAMEEGIDVDVHINDLSGIRIRCDCLVTLLANLMDNAIEACLRTEGKRQIRLRFELNGGSLYLSIRNTSNPVCIVDNKIPTSKSEKEAHGFGLPLVDTILKELQAEYIRAYADGWFEFAAEIPQSA